MSSTECVNSSLVRFARKFFGSFARRLAILQLMCSQTRRKLPEELIQKLSTKPCDRAIDALCTHSELFTGPLADRRRVADVFHRRRRRLVLHAGPRPPDAARAPLHRAASDHHRDDTLGRRISGTWDKIRCTTEWGVLSFARF